MAPTKMTDWMKTGFIGYGRLDAELWVLGMEEHCLDDADAARRLKLLPSFPLTLGVRDAHRRYEFDELPRGVAVWDIASELARACGLNTQRIGELDGDVLLAELLPLPRPTNDTWPPAYRMLFADYHSYARALLSTRAARYASLIVEHAPRVVIVHGARYHGDLETAVMALGGARDARLFTLGNKPARVLEIGQTRIVLVHNFGRSAGWSADARVTLSTFITSLWRNEALTQFETSSSGVAIETLLVGMFHHRMGNVLPPEVANALPGFTLDASKASLIGVVRREDFCYWATRRWRPLGGRTAIEACIARDLEDLRDDAKRYTRLHKRYGGHSADEIRAAVANAHARILAWQHSKL